MSPRNRGLCAGMGGFFAGGFVASIVPWSPLPKAVVVMVVAGLITALALVTTRPSDPA